MSYTGDDDGNLCIWCVCVYANVHPNTTGNDTFSKQNKKRKEEKNNGLRGFCSAFIIQWQTIMFLNHMA